MIHQYREDLVKALGLYTVLFLDHQLTQGKTPAAAALAAKEQIDEIADRAIEEAQRHAE